MIDVMCWRCRREGRMTKLGWASSTASGVTIKCPNCGAKNQVGVAEQLTISRPTFSVATATGG